MREVRDSLPCKIASVNADAVHTSIKHFEIDGVKVASTHAEWSSGRDFVQQKLVRARTRRRLVRAGEGAAHLCRARRHRFTVPHLVGADAAHAPQRGRRSSSSSSGGSGHEQAE